MNQLLYIVVVVVAALSCIHCHRLEVVEEDEQMALGRISVQISSASFSKEERIFVRVCLQNSTRLVVFPIADWDAQCSARCATELPDRSTANPNWNLHCPELDQYNFLWDSRVSFEVWSLINLSGEVRTFIDGSSRTIPELEQAGLNGKSIHLPVKDSKHTVEGQVNVVIDWKELH